MLVGIHAEAAGGFGKNGHPIKSEYRARVHTKQCPFLA
jgi:hypothetical protein